MQSARLIVNEHNYDDGAPHIKLSYVPSAGTTPFNVGFENVGPQTLVVNAGSQRIEIEPGKFRLFQGNTITLAANPLEVDVDVPDGNGGTTTQTVSIPGTAVVFVHT